MLRNKPTLALFAVCASVSACTPVQNKEDMLAAAGFTLEPANTPQRQGLLASLPPHKFVQRVHNKVVAYTYADPTICDCLYVGNQAAYDQYRREVAEKNFVKEQQMDAQIEEGEWYGFGPGGY